MITVVIASYRYGHLAAHAVESVLCQTRKADQIFFVDDAAGDCEHIPHLYKEIEFIARPENLGIVANFQDMLQRVGKGRVLFLGADNWLRPDALEVLEKRNAEIVSSDIALFGTEAPDFAAVVGATEVQDGSILWRFSKGDISVRNYIHGSSLYDAEFAIDAGGYAASGGRNSEEDWTLWRRMMARGARHEHVSEPLLFYRRHRENFHLIPFWEKVLGRFKRRRLWRGR